VLGIGKELGELVLGRQGRVVFAKYRAVVPREPVTFASTDDYTLSDQHACRLRDLRNDTGGEIAID
jgi:hypothetical protein